MRIAQIVTRSDVVAGVQVHICELSCALIAQGHEVVVLAGGSGVFFEELSRRRIPFRRVEKLIRSIHAPTDWRALQEIRRMLREIRPELVVLHSSKAGLLGRIAARSLGIPAVFTCHGWAFTEGVPRAAARFYRLVESIAGRLGCRIITVSNYDRNLALRHRVVPPDAMTTVYNGVVDIPEHLMAEPADQPARLVMVARFEEPKDHTSLLTALAGIRDQPWTMEMIGDGRLRPPAQELSAELGIADRVDFLGSRRDVAERLCKAQILVLISRWEALPICILEAMRAGLPVVASDVGGIGEAVSDGVTGFLIPRDDIAALAAHLSRLCQEPGLRSAMGAAGRRRYEDMFTFDDMFRKTLAVFHSSCGQNDV